MSKKDLKKIEKEADIKLTIKQARFFEEWLNNGGNGTQAAMKVYDAKDLKTAGNIASENLAKLGNYRKFYFENHGITIDSVFKVYKEAMEATRWNDFTGDREPDHNIRLKAAIKADEALHPEDKTQQTNVQVNFNQFIQKEKDEYQI